MKMKNEARVSAQAHTVQRKHSLHTQTQAHTHSYVKEKPIVFQYLFQAALHSLTIARKLVYMCEEVDTYNMCVCLPACPPACHRCLCYDQIHQFCSANLS